MRLNHFIWPASSVAFSAPMVMWDIKKAREEKKWVPWEATKSIVRNNWLGLVLIGAQRPFLASIAFSAALVARPLSTAAMHEVRSRNQFLRLSATPFSQRFDHSDWTWESQQRGIRAISDARGDIGGEAGALARRYGRR